MSDTNSEKHWQRKQEQETPVPVPPPATEPARASANTDSLREVLEAAVAWNYEYKKLNNLAGGNPHWVNWAEKVLAHPPVPSSEREAWIAKMVEAMRHDFFDTGYILSLAWNAASAAAEKRLMATGPCGKHPLAAYDIGKNHCLCLLCRDLRRARRGERNGTMSTLIQVDEKLIDLIIEAFWEWAEPDHKPDEVTRLYVKTEILPKLTAHTELAVAAALEQAVAAIKAAETPKPTKKPTIAELEAILNQPEQGVIEIGPYGSIHVGDSYAVLAVRTLSPDPHAVERLQVAAAIEEHQLGCRECFVNSDTGYLEICSRAQDLLARQKELETKGKP